MHSVESWEKAENSPVEYDCAPQNRLDKKSVANPQSFIIIPACLCGMCTTRYDIRNTKIGRCFNGTSYGTWN